MGPLGPPRCQVIDAATADMSIDPLRVFTNLAVGARYALSYLTVQLGVGAMTEHGALLKAAVKQAANAPAPSMGLVLDALEAMAMEASARGRPAAALVEWLLVAADEPLAAAVETRPDVADEWLRPGGQSRPRRASCFTALSRMISFSASRNPTRAARACAPGVPPSAQIAFTASARFSSQARCSGTQ